MDASPAAPFSLDEWWVEPALNQITRSGTVRHLRPRLMDLLVFLARRSAQVVTKTEILEQVWHQPFVSESVLTRSIADLRQLLCDDVERPRYIETIAKRGYRLVAATTSRPPGSSSLKACSSIVVLPFADLSPARDQEYFCDGLAEELTNSLAQQDGLRVVARTSAFAFKGRSLDVREIGRQLDVVTVLEGAVQRAGDRLRVTVQLIDIADGCHRWSQRFDRSASDLFEIEDQIVRDVTAALRGQLLGHTPGRAMVKTTTSPAAHDLYLKGKHLSARRSPEPIQHALECFAAAIEKDPTYAAAHAAIGECRAVQGFAGFAPPLDVVPYAKGGALRAVELAPELPEGHAVLGHVTGMFEWQWGEAERHFQRALGLNPGYALARIWYSHLLTASGRFDEAIEETERACECDPLSPTVRTTLGLALYYARRFDRAEETFRAVLAADPSFPLAHFHLGRLCTLQQRFEEAIEQFAAASTLPVAMGFLAGVWGLLGRPERAVTVRRELEQVARARYVSPIAWFSANLGNPEAQAYWLKQALDAREGTAPLLNTDPAFDVLRGLPQVRALVTRLGLPWVEDAGSVRGGMCL